MAHPGERVRQARRRGVLVRRTEVTWEAVLDLVFEVRPLFNGDPPRGKEQLLPLQEEVLAAAEELRVLRPSERP